MNVFEEFLSPSLPEGFYWFHEPPDFRLGNGLEIRTAARSDFWQKTHYGFQRDDGHCLFARRSGDFSVSTRVEFEPREQYDQCGLMVRVDDKNWIKVSTEYEDAETSRLGSVVTNLGYSDWATQDVASSHREMWYRISRRGSDFLIESSFDGDDWLQMRIAHLHILVEPLQVGLYACSPIGKAFRSRFSFLRFSDNAWFGKGE
jgi:hypothetical protein